MKGGEMPRGPIVTAEVEALIAAIYQKYRSRWKAPAVRNEVSYILRKDNPKLSPGWPSLSAVQKVLATVRKPHDNPQEKPWSTDSLDSYPIPPDALPVVLKVWKSRIEKGEGFTIREAKWTARLSGLITGLITDIEALSAKTSQYARMELMYDIIGQPFDSTHLDRLLMGLPVPLTTPRSLLPFLAEQEDGRGTSCGIGTSI